jgi:hypothetical protein
MRFHVYLMFLLYHVHLMEDYVEWRRACSRAMTAKLDDCKGNVIGGGKHEKTPLHM